MADESVGRFIANLVFWLFLPSLASQILLSLYYQVKYRKRQRPAKGTSEYGRHYRNSYLIVSICLFTYCMTDYVLKLKPSYYKLIGVDRVEIDDRLKTHFRHTVISLHPDKNPNADPSKFMQLKQIYEVLNNDATRFAYDCYGPEIIKAVNLSSLKASARATLPEYFNQAFIEWTAFYVGSVVFLLIATLFGNKSGTFCRILGLSCLSIIELYCIMRPSKFGAINALEKQFTIPLLSRWFHNIPCYMILGFLRQAYIFGGLALGQIAGLGKSKSTEEQTKDLVIKLEKLSTLQLSNEIDFLLASELGPVSNSQEMRDLLQSKMGLLAVEVQIFESLSPLERKKLLARKSD